MRAPPVTEEASKKEWQRSKFCERMRAKNFGHRNRSCHGFAVTEGLPGVAGYFGDDLCSDSRPSLATAAHTLRCAPLARVVDAASLSPRKGRCPHRPVAKHHLWRFRRAGCDYTPPSCSAPPVGGGLRPAPLGKASVLRQFPLVPEHHPISCRGGPMCPPGHAFLRDLPTGRHAGRPLQILLQSSSTPQKPGGDRDPPLQSTNAQCRFKIYRAIPTLVSRKPKHLE